MNVSVNGILVNNNATGVAAGVTAPVKLEKDSTTLYAGEIAGNTGAAGSVADKRAMARKQARALISDAWDRDISVARGIEELEKAKADKLVEIQSYRKSIDTLDERRAGYMDEYGINPESSEHKDLLLLEKYQDYKKGIPVEDFSDEEIARLKELQNQPRTEYQEKMLELNGAKGDMNNAIYIAEQEHRLLMQELSESRINLPKTETMDKAQDAAEKIMDAARKEAMGEYVQEGVSKVEENMEETSEEADKIREEKEERQEQIDEIKEKKEEQEELLDGVAKADRMDSKLQTGEEEYSNVIKAQEKIQHILKRTNMDIEELKGIEIDFKY